LNRAFRSGFRLRTLSFSATPAETFLSTLDAEELYDMTVDPYEHSNLLDDGNLSAEKPKQHRLLKTQIEALRVGTSSAGRYYRTAVGMPV